MEGRGVGKRTRESRRPGEKVGERRTEGERERREKEGEGKRAMVSPICTCTHVRVCLCVSMSVCRGPEEVPMKGRKGVRPRTDDVSGIVALGGPSYVTIEDFHPQPPQSTSFPRIVGGWVMVPDRPSQTTCTTSTLTPFPSVTHLGSSFLPVLRGLCSIRTLPRRFGTPTYNQGRPTQSWDSFPI